ncbi:MAG TPA: ATP-binding protein, partial [Candidatus Sulfotelmatobacter sp.]|nr:ATP-binding protein [Candidatus Sulfotelmatobacter sp.]
MNRRLRILHLEDDPDFPSLVKSMLEREGMPTELTVVDNRVAYETVLARESFDAILADYLVGDFNGIEALQIAQKQCPDTPFLLVSGTIGEQAAIEGLKAGATDYVLKLYLERLVPALSRAVREAEERAERRRIEAELVRREKHFRTLTENALDILTILSREGRYLYNSPSVERVLGYQPGELAGQEAFASIHPEDLLRVKAAFAEAVSEPQHTVRLEFRFRHKDGSWRFLEAIGQSHLAEPEIGGVVVNSRDVTDRKHLEDQLRHSQKMEAIGQLAGGVAHDFNNILTVIHGHASLLLAGGQLAGPTVRSAQQIAQAAERAAGLTRQLLAFSRRQVMQPRRLDFNEVVGNITKMLSRLLGEDVALQLHYYPQAAFVQADAGMMEQVLLNLAVNARDAMPKGGLLAIRVGVRDMDSHHLAHHAEAYPGRFVCLTVSDTGCGIPPENLRRVFEPFFTTKEVGKGTGLGLATVYGIVQQHQGWIEVESEVGKGTSFRVFVPCSCQVGELEEKPRLEKRVRGGTETILIVEDEAPVRELVCSLLASQGYQVLQAESGAKALKMWGECK